MIHLIEMIDPMPMQQFIDMLGFIPTFVIEDSEVPVKEQIDANYQHGGGWRGFDGFKIVRHNPMTIQYPGDPELKAFARFTVNKETVYVFPFAWVMIMQEDGSWDIARID